MNVTKKSLYSVLLEVLTENKIPLTNKLIFLNPSSYYRIIIFHKITILNKFILN